MTGLGGYGAGLAVEVDFTGAAPALAATDPTARTAIERGDRAWEGRAEGASGEVAAPGPIAEAVDAYEDALEVDPRNLEAMWKLERALYFQGQYTGLPAPDRERIWDRGVELADRSIAILHDGDSDWAVGGSSLTWANSFFTSESYSAAWNGTQPVSSR